VERTRTHNLAVGSVCKLRAETLPTQPPRHPLSFRLTGVPDESLRGNSLELTGKRRVTCHVCLSSSGRSKITPGFTRGKFADTPRLGLGLRCSDCSELGKRDDCAVIIGDNNAQSSLITTAGDSRGVEHYTALLRSSDCKWRLFSSTSIIICDRLKLYCTLNITSLVSGSWAELKNKLVGDYEINLCQHKQLIVDLGN